MSDFLDQFDKVPLSQKLLLLILLMLGIFVGYFFLFQSKLEEDITAERNRARQLSDQRAELHASAEDVDRLRQEIRELCSRQESFLEKLPPREEVPSLLQAINQQAELTGLTIQRFVRNANVPGANYTTIPVSMAVKGTYDQISDFFYFIGRQQRIVNVSDITMKMPARGGGWRLTEGRAEADELSWFEAGTQEIGPPTLEVTCTLRTYFADESALTGGDACAE
jgi:type IV pilus assembly protein PilO